ncbi:MAG: ABC transporter substrate-binding protein [Sulfurovum sp.]|uniref:ABC transporter substrate-binding protein n=1 Tax=Sulfurovum sp. TaxID=1969726 RepID=UPI002867E217|nr:ABC transporter substrate-binding protein [Sulfurovum sp.]MCO4845130.1 ABC transporter substrate-binding protein [Sulfurovum sp.]
MKLQIAFEWFLNPDHLPFLVGIHKGYFKKYDLELELIVPDEHYDGLDELIAGNIEFATNEPLHLIEQFHEKFLSLGTYFETQGGVLLKKETYDKVKNGEKITITTPVSNNVTNTIGYEIIRRYFEKDGIDVPRENVHFEDNGFEHIKYMKEGADGGWLYFYNFEGIEAQHEGMDLLYLDAQTSGFANFSALDLFVNKDFYHANEETCKNFDKAVKESITFMNENPNEAMEVYYDHTKEAKSALMDDILKATLVCFDVNYSSDYEKSLPILQFFREIGITSLDDKTFKTAFLH